MSTNNQLIILKENKWFQVHENRCVDNELEPNKKTLLHKNKSFRKAVIFAKKYCQEWPYVEYGYEIDDSCLEGLT